MLMLDLVGWVLLLWKPYKSQQGNCYESKKPDSKGKKGKYIPVTGRGGP
jgi:hypothetical protein